MKFIACRKVTLGDKLEPYGNELLVNLRCVKRFVRTKGKPDVFTDGREWYVCSEKGIMSCIVDLT